MPFAKKAGVLRRASTAAILAFAAASLALVGLSDASAAPAHSAKSGAAGGASHGQAPQVPAVTSPSPQALFAPPPGEVTRFPGWTVTCLPQAKANTPRTCMAKMQILKSKEDPQPILVVNLIKSSGATTFVLQTPTGVDLGPGVTVNLGDATPRKLTYVSCEPALCTSAVLLDDALVHELTGAGKAKVSWMGLGVGEVRVEFDTQDAKGVIGFLDSH